MVIFQHISEVAGEFLPTRGLLCPSSTRELQDHGKEKYEAADKHGEVGWPNTSAEVTEAFNKRDCFKSIMIGKIEGIQQSEENQCTGMCTLVPKKRRVFNSKPSICTKNRLKRYRFSSLVDTTKKKDTDSNSNASYDILCKNRNVLKHIPNL